MSDFSEQQEAIIHSSLMRMGPVVVKAGPGSGKTHTVVGLIKEHLERGMAGEDVIAITFTRRAARELKDRLGRQGRRVQASTIDALALSIAKNRFSDLKLLSPACHWILFQIVCEMHKVKATPEVASLIDEMRVAPYLGNRPAENAKVTEEARLLGAMDQLMTTSNYSDYLGVLLTAIWVLQSGMYRPSCRLLIVDEAQDTSKIQWLLIEELVKRSAAQLVIVGDMNQNIYSWRNAAPEIFHSFAVSEKSLALPLKESFRCQPKIVRASNHLIQFNPDAEADVVSVRDSVFEPVTVSTDRPVLEVLRLMEDLYQPQEIAILCRTNRTVEYLARELAETNVPCNAVKPVQGKVAFLAMAAMFGMNRDNVIHQILFKEAARQISIHLTGNEPEDILASLVTNRNGVSIVKFISSCSNTELVFAEALEEVKDVPELRSSVVEVKKSVGGYFVRDAVEKLVSPAEVESSKDAVTVSTIHQAKGLEWPVVIIADLKEGVFPSKKSIRSEEGIIEERRLMYVAMTRAKDRLVLCVDPVVPSQFVFTKEFYDAEEIQGLGPQTIAESGW
jgi:DNA helicase-2/ATP-dependent DNA helicase PcrA